MMCVSSRTSRHSFPYISIMHSHTKGSRKNPQRQDATVSHGKDEGFDLTEELRNVRAEIGKEDERIGVHDIRSDEELDKLADNKNGLLEDRKRIHRESVKFDAEIRSSLLVLWQACCDSDSRSLSRSQYVHILKCIHQAMLCEEPTGEGRAVRPVMEENKYMVEEVEFVDFALFSKSILQMTDKWSDKVISVDFYRNFVDRLVQSLTVLDVPRGERRLRSPRGILVLEQDVKGGLQESAEGDEERGPATDFIETENYYLPLSQRRKKVEAITNQNRSLQRSTDTQQSGEPASHSGAKEDISCARDEARYERHEYPRIQKLRPYSAVATLRNKGNKAWPQRPITARARLGRRRKSNGKIALKFWKKARLQRKDALQARTKAAHLPGSPIHKVPQKKGRAVQYLFGTRVGIYGKLRVEPTILRARLR